MNSTRPRRTVSSKGTLLNTIRANTVTFENSFYCRAPRIWNTLAAHLRNTDCSVANFKKDLFNYYFYLAKSFYDVDTPRRLRVCVLSAPLASRPLNSLLDRMCTLLIFYRCPPQFCFCIAFLFFSFLKYCRSC